MTHSFLLIGQSNMSGRGLIDEAEYIDKRHIKILRNGHWVPMYRPINPDGYTAGVNLAERFAECYAQKYGVDVGLICCADGGTSLDQWKQGGLLFDHAVMQAKLAQRTSTIAGILWHQGEADCSESLYTTYKERFFQFQKALRTELDLFHVPFLVGGLGDFLKICPLSENLKNYVHMNEVLKSIAREDPMTSFVSAEGLGSNTDHLHFNSHALYEFGKRYFDCYETFAPVMLHETEYCEENRTPTVMEML